MLGGLLIGPLFSATALSRPLLEAADFGLRELAPGADATPIFRKAMETVRKRNARGLKIPAGTWHLYPDHALEQTLVIANNDSGVKRVVFALDGLKDFTLEGPGANFVCHG